MTPTRKLLERLPGAKQSGCNWSARCPAHEDQRASLSIAEGDDGRALVRCHAGCDAERIVTALGLTLRDLMPDRDAPTPIRKPKREVRTFPTASAAVEELERRHGKRSKHWTYHDADRQPTGLVVRWDSPDGKKDIRPVARHGDGWRVGAMPEPRPLYGLPSVVKANRVIVVEGEKAADAARGIGFTATTSAGGSQAAGKTDWTPLAGKEVWILPDNDAPGRKYAETVAGILGTLNPPAVVKIIDLPGLPEKGDIADWVEDLHGDAAEPAGMRDEIEALADAVTPAEAPPSGATPEDSDSTSRSKITIDTDEYRVNAEATQALASEPDIYQRGGMLVRVLEQDEEPDADAVVRRPIGSPTLRALSAPLLRERLTRCAEFTRLKTIGDGGQVELPAHPPGWCVNAVHDRGQWPGIRRLNGVLTHPAIMPGGSILTDNGYHAGAELLVCLPPGLSVTVPDRPTVADVAGAVAALADSLADFPFADPAHRSALLAGLLTPLAWFLFDGPAPLFLIDKNVRGAGAGLLADVAALTVTGRRFPVMSYTNDREELRKKITTLAIEGERLVLLDNLAGAVGNDVLDMALTADTWKDRVLGSNKVYDGPLHVVWFATGNNVQLHADTSRRVCHVRMESNEERPETRTGFRHPDLRAHVRANRGKLLSAALTILKGWVVAGRPTHNLTPWGSYEGWSGVVREALVFAGLPDPGETREALQSAADRDAAAMADIIAGLAELDPVRRGRTTADIITYLKETNPLPDWAVDMRSAVEELCGRLDARSLGYKFRHFARRNFGGRMLNRARKDQIKGNRWAVYSARANYSQPKPSSPSSSSSAPAPSRDDGDDQDDGFTPEKIAPGDYPTDPTVR